MLFEADSSRNVRQYSPLALAHLGDAVYELFVREHMIAKANTSAQNLHNQTVSWVCAHAQAAAMEELLPLLSEEELAVFKRGRNANGHPPKHANVQEYRRATGFEALFGYLYLDGRFDRLRELFAVVCRVLESHA